MEFTPSHERRFLRPKVVGETCLWLYATAFHVLKSQLRSLLPYWRWRAAFTLISGFAICWNGNSTIVFFAAVIYSIAVSVGIYAFWTFLMRFLPHVQESKSRRLLFACMGLGALMIMAMSAWLNASALAGAAAIQQHLATAVQAYTRDLDRAHNNTLAAQSLLPDIQMASTRFSKLAESERGGSLTGTSGSGTVVQLLTQMSNQLASLGQEVSGSADKLAPLFEQGSKHLEKMRELVSDRGPISARKRRLRQGGDEPDGCDRQDAADVGRACCQARG